MGEEVSVSVLVTLIVQVVPEQVLTVIVLLCAEVAEECALSGVSSPDDIM